MNGPSHGNLVSINSIGTHSIRLAARQPAEPGPGQEGLQGALERGEYETPNGHECSSFQHLFLLFSARCPSSSASESLHSRCCNANDFFQTVYYPGKVLLNTFLQHLAKNHTLMSVSEGFNWSGGAQYITHCYLAAVVEKILSSFT